MVLGAVGVGLAVVFLSLSSVAAWIAVGAGLAPGVAGVGLALRDRSTSDLN